MGSAHPPDDLLAQGWSDPDSRSVILDWYEQNGVDASRTVRAFSFLGSATDADADADAATDATADADAAADAATDATADADAATDAADATADADAAAADADIRSLRLPFLEVDMTPGLKIIQIAITHYRAITFIGWLRHVRGDEFVLEPGARIIHKDPSAEWDWNGIDNLAANGPGTGKRYRLTEPMKMHEELHRLGSIRRSKPANEEAWRKHVPKPKDWP